MARNDDNRTQQEKAHQGGRSHTSTRDSRTNDAKTEPRRFAQLALVAPLIAFGLLVSTGTASAGEEPRTWDRSPETPSDTRFFDLRESGYKGWIDQDGYAVSCPLCGNASCTATLTERCNGS